MNLVTTLVNADLRLYTSCVRSVHVHGGGGVKQTFGFRFIMCIFQGIWIRTMYDLAQGCLVGAASL